MSHCCDFASDEGTGEAQIVKNDDDPRDALAQLVAIVDLTNFNGVYSTLSTQ